MQDPTPKLDPETGSPQIKASHEVIRALESTKRWTDVSGVTSGLKKSRAIWDSTKDKDEN